MRAQRLGAFGAPRPMRIRDRCGPSIVLGASDLEMIHLVDSAPTLGPIDSAHIGRTLVLLSCATRRIVLEEEEDGVALYGARTLTAESLTRITVAADGVWWAATCPVSGGDLQRGKRARREHGRLLP